jgi:hypothetical protein
MVVLRTTVSHTWYLPRVSISDKGPILHAVKNHAKDNVLRLNDMSFMCFNCSMRPTCLCSAYHCLLVPGVTCCLLLVLFTCYSCKLLVGVTCAHSWLVTCGSRDPACAEGRGVPDPV